MEAVARKILNSAKEMAPGRFEVRPATRQSHPHVAWRDYDVAKRIMEVLGFRWVGDVDVVSVTNNDSISRPTVLRIFVSHDGVIVGGFYRMALRWTFGGILGRLAGGGKGIVDVSSAFTDGTVLETSSAPLVGRWESPPFLRREYQPQMHPAALVARHIQRVGEQMGWNPAAQPCRVATLDEVVAVTDAIERKKREFRQSIGWITRDELAKHGATGAQLDKLYAIVQRMVAAEAATSHRPHPFGLGGLPRPAAAASTFVAPPPPPPPSAPVETAASPAATAGFETGRTEDVPDAAPSATASLPEPVAAEVPGAPAEPPLVDLPLSGSALDAEPARPDAGTGPAVGHPRPLEEVVGRALVMNALLNLHFRAPVEVVRRWVEANGVAEHLSPRERALLAKPNAEVTPEERAELRGYMEGLWALLWAGVVAYDLSPDRAVPADMARLVPSLKKNEDASMLSGRMRLRSAAELAGMRDEYERRYGAIMNDLSPPDHIARLEQRRKALAWVLDSTADWDTMVTTARWP
ncbi:MAG TPA: DUF4272 domain-containing protein [Longimicrobium sp.]|jgi:hypothetical protein